MKSNPTAAAPTGARPLDPATREERPRIRRALLDHYDEHRRRLPWREERDPYRILVSEVMLQQTRVETVLDYYGPWLDRFPDLESLADADPDEVLERWEGLGYYRRARNLHRTARVVRERHGGSLPTTLTGLRALPGVGEYTAGAVASIAFGQAVPAPDGNVKRVLARLFDEPAPKPAWLRDRAAELVDPDRPGDWNQALMELGATVCTPRRPACDVCPVARWCRARAAGTQELRPAPALRKPPRQAVFAVAVVHDRGRVLLTRRPEGGLLGGMWAFPEAELGRAGEAVDASHARTAPGAAKVEAVGDAGGAGNAGSGGSAGSEEEVLAAVHGIVEGLADQGVVSGRGVVALAPAVRPEPAPSPPPPPLQARPLPPCEHRFTHLQATYLPYVVDGSGLQLSDLEAGTWVVLSEPTGVALPVAQRRILESAREALTGSTA